MAIIMLLHWIILEKDSDILFHVFLSISSCVTPQERLLLSIERKKVLHIEANKIFMTSWKLLDYTFCGMFFKLASPQCCKLLETLKKYSLVRFWVYLLGLKRKCLVPFREHLQFRIIWRNYVKFRFLESDVKWCWNPFEDDAQVCLASIILFALLSLAKQ